MHELGITQSIIGIVNEQAAGRDVQRVKLQIGRLSAIMPDAVRFCFEACTEGTKLARAKLEIEEIDGRGRCNACGAELELTSIIRRCKCGSHDVDCIAGEELLIKEMEVL